MLRATVTGYGKTHAEAVMVMEAQLDALFELGYVRVGAGTPEILDGEWVAAARVEWEGFHYEHRQQASSGVLEGTAWS